MSQTALTVASAHGTLAALRRHHPEKLEHIEPARRDLAAAVLEQYVAKVVAAAPPFTPAQRDRIAALLRPVGDAA